MNDLARTTPIDLRAPGAQPYQARHYAAFRLEDGEPTLPHDFSEQVSV